MTAIATLLQRIPILSALDKTQLATIAELCERRAYRANDMISYAGEPADAAFFLIDGAVDCLTVVDGESIATPIPQGSTVLELAMIVELDAGASCQARGTAKVLRIPRAALHTAMQNDMALADVILETLTLRLRDMADTMRAAAAPFEATKKTA